MAPNRAPNRGDPIFIRLYDDWYIWAEADDLLGEGSK